MPKGSARKDARKEAAIPLLLRDPQTVLTVDAVQSLFAYIDTQTKVTVDPRESMHDRLFNAIMARVDLLQAQREAYLSVMMRLQRHPQFWPLILRAAGTSATTLLHDTGLLADDRRRHAQVAGVLVAMFATLRAWQTDTSADLSATLRACDSNLRRGATFAAWLGFV